MWVKLTQTKLTESTRRVQLQGTESDQSDPFQEACKRDKNQKTSLVWKATSERALQRGFKNQDALLDSTWRLACARGLRLAVRGSTSEHVVNQREHVAAVSHVGSHALPLNRMVLRNDILGVELRCP